MYEVVALTLLLGVAVLLYLYVSNIYNYWRKRGIPQPPTTFGFGHIYDAVVMKRNTGIILDDIYKSYPQHDAVGVYGFLKPKLLLKNPELIKRVLTTEFSSFHDNEFSVNEKNDPYFAADPFVIRGEKWKPSRSKLVSTLTPARIKEVFPLMKNIVPRLHDYLNNIISKDVEVKELATLFTMDNVSDIVFGISSNCFLDPEAPFRKFGEIVVQEQLQVWWKTMILILMPKVRDLIGFKLIPTAVSNYLEECFHGMVEYRQKNNISRNDLFQYILKKESGNVRQLIEYGATFFLEGFETSSMVAGNVLYELALNPEVQQNLYEEVKTMYDQHKDIDYETMMDLPYLEKVLQEAQRKYPVLFFFSRLCTKPCTLDIDGKSVKIETGTPMLIPVFSIQRDPRYYPGPEVFDPERFNEENRAARPAYTYMPFGEGPRICPGQKFALAQVKLFISSIVYNYRLQMTNNTPQKITFSSSAFMVTPNEKLLVRFEKRQ